MTLVSTDNTIRIEEPGTFRVSHGALVITDAGGTNAYGEGDTFTVPENGGASVYCLTQAIYGPYEPKKTVKKKKVSK